MERIDLATTGRTTTRLGYGCSSLMGALGRKESLGLLEAAFDAGVRHFDVAPLYGFGQAESCVGEFLSRHKAEVTVTTKYGIPPAKNPGAGWVGALDGAAAGEGSAGAKARAFECGGEGALEQPEGLVYGGAGAGVAGAEPARAADGTGRCVAAA